MLKKISIIIFVFNVFIYVQNYYYFNGNKIFIEPEPNRYVIEFNDNISEKGRMTFLIKNELKMATETINEKYVLIESARLGKKEVENNAKLDKVANHINAVLVPLSGMDLT